MKTTDLLQRAIQKARRLTLQDIIDGNRKRFSDLGIDDNELELMARSVGLEIDDLLLLRCNPTVIARPASSTPIWIAEARELWFQGKLIKKFEKTAPNQRRVLDAFQKSGWSLQIKQLFDEYRGSFSSHPAKRTADDLCKGLMQPSPIRFGISNNGMSMTWRICETCTDSVPPCSDI